MSLAPELIALLTCPETGAALELKDGALVSVKSESSQHYPIIGDIPWLLANPRNSLNDWSAKLNHFNKVLLHEIKALERELKHASGATHTRLSSLKHGKEQFIRRVSELLMPVVAAQATTKNVYDTLRDRAPNTQNLLSYEANLYRDWVWGDEENNLTRDIVLKHIDTQTCGQLLVLGAGAGRLALDIHDAVSPTLTVATDINPLLVMAARHLLENKTLDLFEFPLQPRSSQCIAIEHHLKGRKKPDNFHWVFADALKPAFKKSAFDTLITPWLIDIQPLEFSRFMRQLNQYLPVGGQWINFGSLVFNQKRDAHCYSLEEILTIAADQGFDIADVQEEEIPYLKSPYNAGYRMERIWHWRAIKTHDVKALSQPDILPGWILKPDQPVPQAEFIKQFCFKHRTYAQLASEVDGKASLNKIARKLARQNGGDEAEVLQMLRNFFCEMYQQNT